MRLFAPNRFRIASPLGLAEARAAIRTSLDQRPAGMDHVWGFVAGRFVWLMLSFGQLSPTAYGWISETPEGVVVSGFRRVSVTSYLFLAICIGITAGRFVLLEDRAGLGAALVLVGTTAMVAWSDHRWHDDGDVLVAHLRRALRAENPEELSTARPLHVARPDIADAASTVPVAGARLIFDGERGRFTASEAGLMDAVAALDAENFVILEFTELEYMQAALTPGGFWIEYRSGGADRHFRCEPLVDRDSTAAILLHYLRARQPFPGLDWQALAV